MTQFNLKILGLNAAKNGPFRTPKAFLTASFCGLSLLMLGACEQAEHPVKKEEVSLKAVPSAVLEVVKTTNPDFTIQEIVKKTTNKGNVYYDVEGTIGSGAELEYDVLMDGDQAIIVETQRDITVAELPEAVATLALAENDGKAPIRIIESLQTDGRIIYEFFTQSGQSAPVFEIMRDGDTVELLDERWKH